MVLLIDNYDSFTYNLYDYMLQLGIACKVVRNDELSLAQLGDIPFTSAVISPGPKTPADAGITMPFIGQFHNRVPILGICLGHQALGQFFGARLVKAKCPMHGKTSVVKHNGHFLFDGIEASFPVMRYHSLLLDMEISADLDVIATTADNEVMALAHKRFPLVGLQFHPESVLTPAGLTMLGNWFKHIA